MKTFLACCVLGAGGIIGSSAAEFKIGARTFNLPEGFTIELVAQAPLTDRPVEADFDDQGRLYVTDSSGTNDKIEKQLIDRPHRVVRLEDTDGNGKFDKSIVFADKLSFPEGAMFFEGSLYVSVPPSIWKFTDTDNDGVADKREEWFKGQTVTGCANDLHGPYLGPDGWIYWNKGAFAKQTHERPGQAPFVTRASHTFRARPDGTGLEAVMTGGMDNPVGLAFTPEGERFFTCTFIQNPEGGRRDALVHSIYGGVYGKIHDVLDDHPQTGEVMPVTTHLGAAAPAGLMRYESAVMGEAYSNNMFVCQFNLHKVSRHILQHEGATYKTIDSDFVTASDTDFHPTDVFEDADGSILIIDTGGWYKLCCPTSQLAKPDVLGAIYRIRKTGAKPLTDPRGKNINWPSMSAKNLASYLADDRPVVRKRASTLLSRMGQEAATELERNLDKQSHLAPEAAVASIWTLAKMDSSIGLPVIRQLLMQGLWGSDRCQIAAINAVGLVRDVASRKALLRRLQYPNEISSSGAPNPFVVLAAAEALGRIGDPTVVPAFLEATARNSETDATSQRIYEHTVIPALLAAAAINYEFDSTSQRIYEHTLAYALIEIGYAAAIRSEMANHKSIAKKVALIALSQLKDGLQPTDIAPLFSDSGDLRKTAEWIALKHPEWGGSFAELFHQQLNGSDDGKTLEPILARLASSREIQQLLAELTGHQKPAIQMLALRAMAKSGSRKTPDGWADAIAPLITTSDEALSKQAIATARAINAGKDATKLVAALASASTKSGSPGAIRLAAARALPDGSTVSPEVFALALQNLDPQTSMEVRSDAVGILTRSNLTDTQRLALADAFAKAGPMELSRLFDAFEKHATEPNGLRLVDALKKSTVIASLPPEFVPLKLAKFPDSVRKAAESLPRASQGDAAAQRAHLEDFATALKTADGRRGQAIFNSVETACTSCHAIGYVGGKLGPDLTTIGQVRTEMDLLEAIVYPSASFVRSYEPVFVKTKDDAYTGVLRGESDDSILLVTGPNMEERIPRANIVTMQPSAVSLMPAGLESMLTKQELADLVAFLKGTKWGAN